MIGALLIVLAAICCLVCFPCLSDASAGHVITNYHVITDASDIQVTFMGGAEYSAKVIGLDQDKDIAVLKVRLFWEL
jgi:S1-C subfamily serine protease